LFGLRAGRDGLRRQVLLERQVPEADLAAAADDDAAVVLLLFQESLGLFESVPSGSAARGDALLGHRFRRPATGHLGPSGPPGGPASRAPARGGAPRSARPAAGPDAARASGPAI